MSRGQKIGPEDFLYGKLLGEGAYAKVLHCRVKDELLQGKGPSPDLAVKIMEKRFIKKENKIQFVLMERNVMSRAQHPNIVRLMYTFQDEENLYLVMDLCKGGELFKLIKHYMALLPSPDSSKHFSTDPSTGAKQRRRMVRLGTAEWPSAPVLPLPLTRFLLAQTVQALEYLHCRMKVVHRDLKPENLLLTERGLLKVTDFGTAKDENAAAAAATAGAAAGGGANKSSSSSSDAAGGAAGSKAAFSDWQDSAFVGTAEYVAPELLREELAHAPVDFWALGCVLYQCCTGSPPFRGNSEYATFQQILGFDWLATREAYGRADSRLQSRKQQREEQSKKGQHKEAFQRAGEEGTSEAKEAEEEELQLGPVSALSLDGRTRIRLDNGVGIVYDKTYKLGTSAPNSKSSLRKPSGAGEGKDASLAGELSGSDRDTASSSACSREGAAAVGAAGPAARSNRRSIASDVSFAEKREEENCSDEDEEQEEQEDEEDEEGGLPLGALELEEAAAKPKKNPPSPRKQETGRDSPHKAKGTETLPAASQAAGAGKQQEEDEGASDSASDCYSVLDRGDEEDEDDEEDGMEDSSLSSPRRCLLRFPPAVPKEARDLILALLNPDPKARLGVCAPLAPAATPVAAAVAAPASLPGAGAPEGTASNAAGETASNAAGEPAVTAEVAAVAQADTSPTPAAAVETSLSAAAASPAAAPAASSPSPSPSPASSADPGIPCGPVRLSYKQLKAHPFFAGIDWAALADPRQLFMMRPPLDLPPCAPLPPPKAIGAASLADLDADLNELGLGHLQLSASMQAQSRMMMMGIGGGGGSSYSAGGAGVLAGSYSSGGVMQSRGGGGGAAGSSFLPSVSEGQDQSQYQNRSGGTIPYYRAGAGAGAGAGAAGQGQGQQSLQQAVIFRGLRTNSDVSSLSTLGNRGAGSLSNAGAGAATAADSGGLRMLLAGGSGGGSNSTAARPLPSGGAAGSNQPHSSSSSSSSSSDVAMPAPSLSSSLFTSFFTSTAVTSFFGLNSSSSSSSSSAAAATASTATAGGGGFSLRDSTMPPLSSSISSTNSGGSGPAAGAGGPGWLQFGLGGSREQSPARPISGRSDGGGIGGLLRSIQRSVSPSPVRNAGGGGGGSSNGSRSNSNGIATALAGGPASSGLAGSAGGSGSGAGLGAGAGMLTPGHRRGRSQGQQQYSTPGAVDASGSAMTGGAAVAGGVAPFYLGGYLAPVLEGASPFQESPSQDSPAAASTAAGVASRSPGRHSSSSSSTKPTPLKGSMGGGAAAAAGTAGGDAEREEERQAPLEPWLLVGSTSNPAAVTMSILLPSHMVPRLLDSDEQLPQVTLLFTDPSSAAAAAGEEGEEGARAAAAAAAAEGTSSSPPSSPPSSLLSFYQEDYFHAELGSEGEAVTIRGGASRGEAAAGGVGGASLGMASARSARSSVRLCVCSSGQGVVVATAAGEGNGSSLTAFLRDGNGGTAGAEGGPSLAGAVAGVASPAADAASAARINLQVICLQCGGVVARAGGSAPSPPASSPPSFYMGASFASPFMSAGSASTASQPSPSSTGAHGGASEPGLLSIRRTSAVGFSSTAGAAGAAGTEGSSSPAATAGFSSSSSGSSSLWWQKHLQDGEVPLLSAQLLKRRRGMHWAALTNLNLAQMDRLLVLTELRGSAAGVAGVAGGEGSSRNRGGFPRRLLYFHVSSQHLQHSWLLEPVPSSVPTPLAAAIAGSGRGDSGGAGATAALSKRDKGSSSLSSSSSSSSSKSKQLRYSRVEIVPKEMPGPGAAEGAEGQAATGGGGGGGSEGSLSSSAAAGAEGAASPVAVSSPGAPPAGAGGGAAGTSAGGGTSVAGAAGAAEDIPFDLVVDGEVFKLLVPRGSSCSVEQWLEALGCSL